MPGRIARDLFLAPAVASLRRVANFFQHDERAFLLHQVRTVEPAVRLLVDDVALDQHGVGGLDEAGDLGIAAAAGPGVGRPPFDLRPLVRHQRPPLVGIVGVFGEARVDPAGGQDGAVVAVSTANRVGVDLTQLEQPNRAVDEPLLVALFDDGRSFLAANSWSLRKPDFATTRLGPSSAGFTIDSRNSREVSVFQSP